MENEKSKVRILRDHKGNVIGFVANERLSVEELEIRYPRYLYPYAWEKFDKDKEEDCPMCGSKHICDCWKDI